MSGILPAGERTRRHFAELAERIMNTVRHHYTVSTETLTKPDADTRDSTGDDTPKMFHYVRKDKIAESAVVGTMVQALCGEVFPVTKAPKPGSPVCPACKEIYESLRP
jgi:formylmethanofuran dehydrogenase subunit E